MQTLRQWGVEIMLVVILVELMWIVAKLEAIGGIRGL